VANEYATLTELKAARRISSTDDDTALQTVLTVASRAIDRKTGRRFYLDASATARTYNPRGRVVGTDDGHLLIVDDMGSTTGLTVETGSAGGATWTATTDYETDPINAIATNAPITGLLSIGGYWEGRIRVTARWGWPTVPDEIKQATILLANRLYLRKDSPQGITGSADWGVIRVSRWDPDVEALVSPFVLPGFA
jgi:hypothetical protein